jgi:cell division protein FtsI/penicillin-binding protein 2
MHIFYFLLIFLIGIISLWLIRDSFRNIIIIRILSFVGFFGFFAFFIFSYIGFNGGSPRLQEHENIVFEQKGVYAASDENQPVIFTKEPLQTGFSLDKLGENDSIKIKPIWNKPVSSDIKYWLINASVKSYPLRINNKAINVSKDHFFAHKDTFEFISKLDTINLRFIIDEYNDKKDLYYIQHFYKDTLGNRLIIGSDTICFPKIKDGIKVNRLFREINKQNFCDDKEKFKNKQYNINDYPIDSYVKDRVLLVRKIKTSKDIQNEIENPLCILNIARNSSFTTNKISENIAIGYDTIAQGSFIDTLKADDKLAFGYGLDIKFFTFSKKSTKIYENKYVAPIYFKYPKRIKLPDSITGNSFLITSWKEFINFDNIFRIDITGNQLPFFAKAKFNHDFTKVSINTGDTKTDYSINDDFYIDNGLEGVILSFSKNIQKPFFDLNISHLITGILLFAFILFIISWWKNGESREENSVKVLWTILMFVLFFMGIIKLIISYRIASFPPQTANYKEIDLFAKSLQIALFSLFAISSLILFVRFKINGLFIKLSNYLKDLLDSKDKPWIRPFMIWLIFIVILIIGAFTSSNQSAFGLIRLNLLSIIVTFLIMYFLSPDINAKSDNKTVNRSIFFYFFSILSVTLVNLLIVRDVGFLMLYIPIFILIIPFMWLIWDSTLLFNKTDNTSNIIIKFIYKTKWTLAFIVGIVGFMMVLFILPQNSKNSLHRIKADNPEYFLEKELTENTQTFDATLFKNNTYQMWQLQNYASNGKIKGVGFAKAKIINYGTTFPITLTDAFFSTYILSEFGALGGITLLMLFVLVLFLIITISFRLPQPNYRNVWLINSVGIFLFYFAVYMMLANIGAKFIFFTGQNIPFYSLNSKGDLLLFIFLFVFIGYIIFHNKSDEGYRPNYYEFKGSQKYLYNFLGKGLPIVSIMIIVFSIYSFFDIATNDKLKADFSLSKEFIAKFEEKINSNKILPNGDIVGGTQVTEFESAQLELFKERNSESKENPKHGLLYLVGEGSNKKLEINKNYFKLRSPFKTSYIWKGQLYSSDSDSLVKQFNFLTNTASASMGIKDSLYTINTTDRNLHLTGFNRYNMLENGRTLFEIINKNDSIYLKVFEDGKNKVFINGEAVDYGDDAMVEIRNRDIILIKKGENEKERKYYLTLSDIKNNLISRLSWVNGKFKRLYRYNDALPVAYTISKAADYSQINSDKDINLTIKTDIQVDIQNIIKDYVYALPQYNLYNKQIHEVKKVAFTVIDTYSGDVIALGSWPNFNPNDDKFSKYLNNISPYNQSKVLTNSNYKTHLIGSTFKPLALSAMGVAFNADNNYDIGDLNVYHPSHPLTDELSARYETVKERKPRKYENYSHPHFYLSGINFNLNNSNLDFWDCKDPSVYRNNTWLNTQSFITHSLNYYILSLFTVGLIEKNDSIDNYLFPNNTNERSRTRIRFGNQSTRYLDISNSKLFSKTNNNSLSSLTDTYIFSGLDTLFNVTLKRDKDFSEYDTISNTWYNNIKSFIPTFSNNRKQGFLKFIVPEPIIFNADIPHSIDYIEAFARGGDMNSWNNVQLCEAFATISTGNYVTASLERFEKNDSIPIPLSKEWLNRNLINNLHNVVVQGTAGNTRINQICRQNDLHIIAKTGTLREHGNNKPNSGMLMFTIGKYDNENNEFVKGKSYTCYLYLEEGSNYKFRLAENLIEYLANKLNNLETNSNSSSLSPLPSQNSRLRPIYFSSENREISNTLNNNSADVRQFAVNIAGQYPGSYNINQVCAIYDEILGRWNYVSDPHDNEYFATASESILNGFNGDCDDFAILMASSVRSIGGNTRIGTGCNSEGCHAWAEVKIDNDLGNNIEYIKSEIVDYYRRKGTRIQESDIHILKDGNSYWLNLDWQGYPKHAGNRPFNVIRSLNYIE